MTMSVVNEREMQGLDMPVIDGSLRPWLSLLWLSEFREQ